MDVFAATPYTCDRMATPLGTLWIKLCFCLIIVFCLVCVFFFLLISLFCLFIYYTFEFLYIYVHALYRTVSCITYFNFLGSTHNLIKLGGELAICPITIGRGSDA